MPDLDMPLCLVQVCPVSVVKKLCGALRAYLDMNACILCLDLCSGPVRTGNPHSDNSISRVGMEMAVALFSLATKAFSPCFPCLVGATASTLGVRVSVLVAAQCVWRGSYC